MSPRDRLNLLLVLLLPGLGVGACMWSWGFRSRALCMAVLILAGLISAGLTLGLRGLFCTWLLAHACCLLYTIRRLPAHA